MTPEELFAYFDTLGIGHRTYSHPPVFTVAEAVRLRGKLPGGHCKSLFLKDKKGRFWLAVMLEERRIDLKKLAAQLGAPRFSLAVPPTSTGFLGCGLEALRLSHSSMMSRGLLPPCSMPECWNATRSITIRWKTIAQQRFRPLIWCALSAPRAMNRSLSSQAISDAAPRRATIEPAPGWSSFLRPSSLFGALVFPAAYRHVVA
jgi:Aminoacyl-tRNA editing domain